MKPSVAKGFSDELAKLGGVSAVLFREPAKVETDPALDKMVKQMPSVQRGKSGRTLDTAMRSRYRDDGVAHNLSSHVGWTSGGQDGSGEAPSAGLRS